LRMSVRGRESELKRWRPTTCKGKRRARILIQCGLVPCRNGVGCKEVVC
jgi:hypothetical protein